MKKICLLVLLLLSFTNSFVLAAGNSYLQRKSDQIPAEELNSVSQKTLEEIQRRENAEQVTENNTEPQVINIFGWFDPTETSSQTSLNGIITGGETRAILGNPNSGNTLETLKFFTKSNDLAVRYTVKLENESWQEEQTGLYDLSMGAGNITAESKKINNLKIRLDGPTSLDYDIYYRPFIKGKGWSNWVSNNAAVLPEESTDQFESLDVRVIPKGNPAPLENTNTQNIPLILSSSHEQDIGTKITEVGKNVTLGTENSGKRLEGFSLATNNPNLTLEYQSYITNIGWQDYRSNNQVSGTEGQQLPIEAVKIRLTGEESKNYDVFYRSYVENYGWLDWANNDMISGTINQGLRLEALKIRILPKGSMLPGNAEVPSIVAVTRDEGNFLRQVNKLRIEKGLLPLTGDRKLHTAAELRLTDLNTKYSHVRPGGNGYETVLNEVEYRKDGLVPATGECFTKTKNIDKAYSNFNTRTICKNLLLTDYYRYISLASSKEDGSPELLTLLLSDTPSDNSLLY